MKSFFTQYRKFLIPILLALAVTLLCTRIIVDEPLIPLVPEEPVSIINFGDAMFDRGVRNIIENRGRDPFEYIKQSPGVISAYDVAILNLEGPIVEMDRTLCQQKDFNFQFAEDTPERLKSIGITMVTIANNHAFDCFRVGFESTKTYLTQAGIGYMGDGLETSYVVKEINGKKVAFIGLDATVGVHPVSSFYPIVKRLSLENDYVVVNIHWGKEYEVVEDQNQITIAHALIDNGADIIFGHHPHVVQPVRIYKGKVIFYSLGNFVFDQGFRQTGVGLGAGVNFFEKKSIFTLHPFNIKSFAPDFMKDTELAAFCEKFLIGIPHTGCTFEISL